MLAEYVSSLRGMYVLPITAGVICVACSLLYGHSDASHYSPWNDCVAGYTWASDTQPPGRNPPYVSSYGELYALKLNKYMEGYADLGQGEGECLKLTGPMSLTVAFQLNKQWPMKAALISKWGFTGGKASYELGLMPDRKVYFCLSTDGHPGQDIIELVTADEIPYEKPTVVTAVYKCGKEMSVYINGRLAAKRNQNVPDRCYDGTAPVKLGPRFEGLIAGVWVHDRVLDKDEIEAFARHLNVILPSGAPYDKWKRLKRNVPRSKAAYLGTTKGMKLIKEIDISAFAGSYLCPGDLNNDGKLDFLLYKNGSSYTVPGRLIAVDADGTKLWEHGDPELTFHAKAGKAEVGKPGTTPALRGIATVFDIDQDGRSEVISELWKNNKPLLCVFDGATGKVKHSIDSPIDMSIRQPSKLGKRQPSRSHPVVRIAWLDGMDTSPSIIVKYGASNGITCHAFALDSSLHVRWHIQGTQHSMGHIPTVADVDKDGRDEVVLGHMLADSNGKVLWDKGLEFTWHADTTAVADLTPDKGQEVFISVCGVGPAYCLSHDGRILWVKSREEIEHGQALWVGNFIDGMPGKEVIILASGHVGCFVTCNGATGETLAGFQHRKLMPAYPDFPAVVNWISREVQSLWIPQDRALVDGRGTIIAELGTMDEYVARKLHCGTSWRPVGAQAFALDICGDERDELLLYEPYEGESIFIFANPDSSLEAKPYIQQSDAYNIRSYF